MVATHCKPSGTIGSNEITVNGLDAARITVYTPGAGPYRGVIVNLHGFPLAQTPMRVPIVSSAYLPDPTLRSWLTGDGWIVICPATPEDTCASGPRSSVIKADVVADAGHGARLATTWLHWWDHLVAWIHRVYGTGWPIVPMGFSFGGIHAFHIVKNRVATLTAYIIWVPVTRMSALTITPPEDYTTGVDWSGMDLSAADALNAATVPGIVGYSTDDTYLGWGIAGEGTCPPGYTLPASYCDLLIVNGQASGRPITRYADTGGAGHGISAAAISDLESYVSTTVDPLAPKVL